MIILCNGMIRAGSTLQFNIVKSILDSLNYKYSVLGYYTVEDIEEKKEELKKCSEEDWVYILKTHDFSFLNTQKSVFVLYSYRNVLDVAASIKRKFNKNGNDLYKGLEKCRLNHHKILKESDILLVQEYESMMTNPSNCIKEILKFLNLKLDEKAIKIIADSNSPEKIRSLQNRKPFQKNVKTSIYNLISKRASIKNIAKGILGHKIFNKLKGKMLPHDNATLLHLDHVSTNLGKNGSWMNILNENEIKYINSKYSTW